MRKRTTRSMLALMLAMTLTACGGAGTAGSPSEEASSAQPAGSEVQTVNETQASGGAEVTDLEFYIPIVAGGALQQTMGEFVEEFNELNPEYHVEMIYTGTMDDNIVKLQSAAQAGTMPQFYLAPYNYKFMLDALGIVDPVDDLVESDEDGEAYIDGFIDSFIRDSYIDGKLVSIPFARSCCIFYYNKDAFREVGLDPESPPETWDELVEMAQKLTKYNDSGSAERWGFGICENQANSQWPWAILTAQKGGQINSDDGAYTYFDSDASIAAVQWWVDLHNVYKCVPDYLLSFVDMPNMFIEGQLAMMEHTSGNLTNIYSNADFEVGVGYLPYADVATSSTGGQNFYLTPGLTEAEREGSWKFIRYCTEPEQQARWCAACGYIATVDDAFETDTLKNYMKEVPGLQNALDQLHQGAVTEINTYECQQIVTLINDYLQASILGDMTVEDAMKELQARADSILSPYRK